MIGAREHQRHPLVEAQAARPERAARVGHFVALKSLAAPSGVDRGDLAARLWRLPTRGRCAELAKQTLSRHLQEPHDMKPVGDMKPWSRTCDMVAAHKVCPPPLEHFERHRSTLADARRAATNVDAYGLPVAISKRDCPPLVLLRMVDQPQPLTREALANVHAPAHSR